MRTTTKVVREMSTITAQQHVALNDMDHQDKVVLGAPRSNDREEPLCSGASDPASEPEADQVGTRLDAW